MRVLGVVEAKRRFSTIVDDALAGRITIVTKNGKAVAQVGPVRTEQSKRGKVAAQRLRALRASLQNEGKLRGIDVRELIY